MNNSFFLAAFILSTCYLYSHSEASPIIETGLSVHETFDNPQEDSIVPEFIQPGTKANMPAALMRDGIFTSEKESTMAQNSATKKKRKPRRKRYNIEVEVAARLNAGSKDTISIQLEDEKGKTTPFKKVGSSFKENETRKRSMLLPSVGDASQIKFIRLRTESGGEDGLLLRSVKVSTGTVSRRRKRSTLKTQTFSGGKRFLKCRAESTRVIPACTMVFEVAKAAGATSCKQCPKTLPQPPTPLNSNFRDPEPDHGGHKLRSRGGPVVVQYAGFANWMDCSRNAAYRFEYVTYADCGCLPRSHGFRVDPDSARIKRSCQQSNGNAYKKTEGVAFDRGHLVPANHLDHDHDAITQSNFMTNILPQAALMNRGAWLQSEELIECLRDKEPVHVVGGAVWDKNDPRYDWFWKSHNVKNPSYFWKVVTVRKHHKEDHHRIAFWMPNNEVVKRGTIDNYVVSIKTLETNLATYGQPQEFFIPADQKEHTPAKAWDHIKGCDKSMR